MDITILFEDNHLLVVEKPVNIPVQADNSKDEDLHAMLKQDIKVRYQKPGNVFLGLVHRLDRPVGGVMVFAKTSKAASRLADTIRRGKMDRKYLTIVRGVPDQQQGTLTHYLWKDRLKNIVYTVPSDYQEGKKSSLSFETISSTENLSLLSVRLHTGRSHQIRVQLSTSGLPLYGDQKYGHHMNKPGQQIALWSNELVFPHPTTKEIHHFRATPPESYPWNLFEAISSHS